MKRTGKVFNFGEIKFVFMGREYEQEVKCSYSKFINFRLSAQDLYPLQIDVDNIQQKMSELVLKKDLVDEDEKIKIDEEINQSKELMDKKEDEIKQSIKEKYEILFGSGSFDELRKEFEEILKEDEIEIEEKSKGNYFFVEAVKSMISGGILESVSKKYQSPEMSDIKKK